MRHLRDTCFCCENINEYLARGKIICVIIYYIKYILQLPLHRCTYKMYIDILKNNLHERVEKMGLKDNFMLMQDNDRKHYAINTRAWIL